MVTIPWQQDITNQYKWFCGIKLTIKDKVAIDLIWFEFIFFCNLQNNIIQILTVTVMKYHVSVDCQESYIFPRGYIFPKRAALRENIITRENITILAPPTRDISSVPVNIYYIRWVKMNDFIKIWWCSVTIMKFGNKTRSLRTKQSERKLDSFARFLLWRSIVNCCVLWLRGAFLSGSIS